MLVHTTVSKTYSSFYDQEKYLKTLKLYKLSVIYKLCLRLPILISYFYNRLNKEWEYFFLDIFEGTPCSSVNTYLL